MVSRARLPGNGRKTRDHGCLGAELQNAGAGQVRYIVCDTQCPMRAPALGMNDALQNALAILVGEFLDQLPVLHEDRAALAGGKTVLVVGD